MYSTHIRLSDVATIKKFVFLANQYEFPIILYSGHCVVNGRSIMGIFSLDLSKEIVVECPEGCSDDFKRKIEPFLCR